MVWVRSVTRLDRIHNPHVWTSRAARRPYTRTNFPRRFTMFL